MNVTFPFLPMLALLFIGLKLTDVIDWSWWWVTAPLWAIPVILLAFFGLAIIGAAIGAFTGSRRR